MFRNGTTTPGDLINTCDTAGGGRRTSVGGTWARTGLPQPLTSATYNANNQQVAWAGQIQSFDLNGNLVTDAQGNTYTWDARDRLTGISGPGLTASFTYDPLGRRIDKAINGQTTSFLYDGLNPVQELSGAQVLANLLTGLGLDEYSPPEEVAGTGLPRNVRYSATAARRRGRRRGGSRPR